MKYCFGMQFIEAIAWQQCATIGHNVVKHGKLKASCAKIATNAISSSSFSEHNSHPPILLLLGYVLTMINGDDGDNADDDVDDNEDEGDDNKKG